MRSYCATSAWRQARGGHRSHSDSDGSAARRAASAASFRIRRPVQRRRRTVTPDGERFLVNTMVSDTSQPLVVVLSWRAGLKNKLPAEPEPSMWKGSAKIAALRAGLWKELAMTRLASAAAFLLLLALVVTPVSAQTGQGRLTGARHRCTTCGTARRDCRRDLSCSHRRAINDHSIRRAVPVPRPSVRHVHADVPPRQLPDNRARRHPAFARDDDHCRR